MGATLLDRSLGRSSTGNAVSAARRVSRLRRHYRLRKKVSGTAARPRLVVTRSNRHVFVQLVDDVAIHTLVSASSMEAEVRSAGGDKTAQSRKVGEIIARRAKEAGITTVVFDRGGYDYHGRIAAVADAARSGGLEF